MNTLVSTFQTRLDISYSEAVWRVIGFCLFLIAIPAVIVTTATFFPKQGSYSERIPLLPGQHVQVSQILDGEVLVEQDQFLQLARGKQSFVAPGDSTISYMVKVDGVSYRHDQKVGYDETRYKVHNQIQEGVVLREFQRRLAAMIGLFIVAPVLAIVVLLIMILLAQSKSYGYSSSYKGVWIT